MIHLQKKIKILETTTSMWSNTIPKLRTPKKNRKKFSKEIAYGLFWIPDKLIVFNTLGCIKIMWVKCGWRFVRFASLQIVLGTRMTHRILNSRLYEKCGSIPVSLALMTKRLRRQGHVLRIMDCQRMTFLVNCLKINRNRWSMAEVGWCCKDKFRRNGNVLGVCKETDLE